MVDMFLWVFVNASLLCIHSSLRFLVPSEIEDG